MEKSTIINQVKKGLIFVLLLSLLFVLNYVLGIKNNELNEFKDNIRIETNLTENTIANVFTVDLVVNNIQMSNDNNVYTYLVNIDSNIKSFIANIDNKEVLVNLDDNNEAYLNIPANSTLTIKNVPIDVKYKITQENKESSIDNELTNEYKGITTLKNEINFYNSKEFVNNPNTKDGIYIIVILFSILVVIKIILNNIKLKRYN